MQKSGPQEGFGTFEELNAWRAGCCEAEDAGRNQDLQGFVSPLRDFGPDPVSKEMSLKCRSRENGGRNVLKNLHCLNTGLNAVENKWS